MALSRANAINMEFIEVGNPGNPATPPNIKKKDWNGDIVDNSTGYGSVAYVFQIGKYETTNDQYIAFLNAVAATDTYELYAVAMNNSIYGGITRSGAAGSYTYLAKPNMGNKPVNFVSWYDCARFANWMHNGQPIGNQDATTTEDGAYTFNGIDVISERSPNALYFLPTEHEWDKTAFYEPGAKTSLGSGWWKNPSASDVYPNSAEVDEFGNVTNPSLHTINFRNTANWNGTKSGNLTTVGSAGNMSHYGAMDMTGNVFEWTLADPTKPDPNGWGPYTVRGGSFLTYGHADVYERNLTHHDNHNIVSPEVGFRLAAAYIEPIDYNLADFNKDTFVDSADLLIWQESYGIEGDMRGDANGDGLTDGRDFLIWQQEFSPAPGNPELPTNSLVSVPEPSSILMMLGVAGLTFCRGRLVQLPVSLSQDNPYI
jgi:formylglycine-generating enzyme required for sulfatase activity